jgi:dihydrofolate reductase
MIITLIAATSRDAVIAKDGQIPWRCPADMAHFKGYTMGKPIIMGRKTFDSLPGKRPLSGRVNIILTSTPGTLPEGAVPAASIDEALAIAGDVPEVCIIGGAQVYAAFLPHAHKMVITQMPYIINLNGRFDEQVVYFPIVQHNKEWHRGEVNNIAKKVDVHTFYHVPVNPFTGKRVGMSTPKAPQS